MKKFFESLSLEVRVGVLILVAVGLLTTFVLALGVNSPRPHERREGPASNMTVRFTPSAEPELLCAEDMAVVCRCVPTR